MLTADTVFQALTENGGEETLKLTSNRLTYRGRYINPHDFVSNPHLSKIWDWFPQYTFKESVRDIPPVQLSQIARDVLRKVGEHIEHMMECDEACPYTAVEERYLFQFIIAIEVSSGQPFLWSKSNRHRSEWDIATLRMKFRPKAWSRVLKEAPFAKYVFDPYRGVDTHWTAEEEGFKVVHCNEYQPPEWQTQNYDPQEMMRREEVYPPFWNRLMENLFKFPEHREMVLDWLSLAMYSSDSRLQTYLSLRGLRGTGKSVFKTIIYHLIGSFYEAKNDINSEFNADLKHKKIVGIDDNESIGTRRGNMTRKNLLNAIISYNEKNVQTVKSERQYASYVILSNPSQSFYVEHDERRILSPTLRTKQFLEWVPPEALPWLAVFEKDRLESEPHLAFLRQIGESLMVRFYRRQPDPAQQLKAGYFWGDVIESLPSFKKYIMQSISYMDAPYLFSYEDLRSEYKLNGNNGNIIGWGKLSSWMLEFRIAETPITHPHLVDHDEKTITLSDEMIRMVENHKKNRG